jgi:hypothetical protein
MILKNQGGFTRHTGVLLSLIILLILLVWNWNTCFAPGGESIYTRLTNWIMGPRGTSKEGFAGDDTKALAAGIDDTKLELKVRPEDKAVDVKFKGITLSANSKVKGYLLVLAKYDKDLKQVGALNVKISDEGGSTFKEQLEAFTDKYKGVLSNTQVANIKNLNTNKKASQVSSDDIVTALVGSTYDNLRTNTQLVDIFFELLYLLYTNRRNDNDSLSNIYTDIQKATSTSFTPTTCTDTVTDCTLPPTTVIGFSTTNDTKSDAEKLKNALTEIPSVRLFFTKSTKSKLFGKITSSEQPYIITKLRDLMDRIVDLYANPPVTSTNKMCDDDGLCKYTFTELEPVDPQGAPYNYKLGVGVVIVGSDGNDKVSKIDAYTYGGPKRLEFFKLTNTLEEQAKLVRRLDMVDRNQLAAAAAAPTPTQALPGTSGSAGSDMDAYMKMLRPYLGDYPNEFQMSKGQMDDVSLSKYLQESLALGQVNVNIGISDLAGATTPTATAAAGTVDFN